MATSPRHCSRSSSYGRLSRNPGTLRRFRFFLRVSLLVVVCAVPGTAAADWLVTPFFGAKFDGQTSLFDPENGAKKSALAIGGSLMLLGDGPFGLEADFGYFPGFFGSKSTLVTGSRALTLTGNVIV